jgi:hypothetical protein
MTQIGVITAVNGLPLRKDRNVDAVALGLMPQQERVEILEELVSPPVDGQEPRGLGVSKICQPDSALA